MLAIRGKGRGRMVALTLVPSMVRVAVWQRAIAWARLCHLCRACGPVARTSDSVGIVVPCTKAAAAYVHPFGLAVRLDRHGVLVCTLPGFAGTADHPAGRSATARRRSWSAASVLFPPHPDASTAVAVSAASAITQARRGRHPVASAGMKRLFLASVRGSAGPGQTVRRRMVVYPPASSATVRAASRPVSPSMVSVVKKRATLCQACAPPMISSTATTART